MRRQGSKCVKILYVFSACLYFLAVFFLLYLMHVSVPVLGILAAASLAALVWLRRYRKSRLKRVEGLLDADPLNPEVHFQHAYCLYERSDLEGATRSFRNAVQLNPSLDIRQPAEIIRYFNQGQSLRHDHKRFVKMMTSLACLEFRLEELERNSSKFEDVFPLEAGRSGSGNVVCDQLEDLILRTIFQIRELKMVYCMLLEEKLSSYCLRRSAKVTLGDREYRLRARLKVRENILHNLQSILRDIRGH